jgi:pyruvate ferredoxin oxidoreductase alpha subunit
MATATVMTGNEATATAAKLARVQVIAAYPITPQTSVVETLSKWVESGELPAEFVTVESEHSALGVVIAASSVGARVFTATSANGLAYMTEQVWWAAGARLPIVMGCVNRAMAAPWSVLNDQQDSMSVRDAGWIQIFCRNNQEILDTFIHAYKIAETLNVPVMVCYDGFLLSHTVMPVQVPEQTTVDSFLPEHPSPPAIIDPADPRNIGPVTLADVRPDAEGTVCHGYMEFRALHQEALLKALDVIPAVDGEFARAFGRSWGGLTWDYRLEDAEVVLVAAGSIATELTVAVDTLRADGLRVGVLGIRAYRPFPATALREALAGKKLAVVFDKALSYGYEGPICTDLRAALLSADASPDVFGCIAGIGGRDVSPALLADAVRGAVDDHAAGVRQRDPFWVNLRLDS